MTAEQLNLSPILMGAANPTGGVMGKMIDAQSIVVASTATRWFGHEGEILFQLPHAGITRRGGRHAGRDGPGPPDGLRAPQRRRHDQLATSTDAHPHHTLVPSRDDTAVSQCDLERRSLAASHPTPAEPATAEPATAQELDRQLGLNESVLRTKLLRRDA